MLKEESYKVQEEVWVPHTGVKLRGFCSSPCKAVGQWSRSTSEGVQVSGAWFWLSPSPCPAGLSEWGLEFATLQTQTRSLLFHYIYDSLRASTSFIKGQYIKQSSSFSLICIYFIFIRVAASLLSLAQIIEHCLYHSSTHLWCTEAGKLRKGDTRKKKITFKTEKVVCSMLTRVVCGILAQALLWMESIREIWLNYLCLLQMCNI